MLIFTFVAYGWFLTGVGMKKKTILHTFFIITSATSLIYTLYMQAEDSRKPIKKETTIILKKDENKPKNNDLKTFGTSLLGGFVGGTLGSQITGARQNKQAVVHGNVTERERRLIENYALLEDEYDNLEREMIRLKRRMNALETDNSALRANNTDLRVDLEKARNKKNKYKELALQKRDENEQLRTELLTYKPEGSATPVPKN